MPELPPVTTYTLPVRSGRESGWNVILARYNGIWSCFGKGL